MPQVGTPLPYAGYGVILADPPWMHDAWSEGGLKRSPSAHYEVMPTDEICALADKLNLAWVCAADSVCVLWGTFPHLARGDMHRVMRTWGFDPKTGGAWGKVTKAGKPHMGTGFIYRGAAECWLLGTRGAPTIRNKRTMNLILDRRRRHSVKPEQMRADLEELFHGPYLDLFSRKSRPRWDTWGKEAGKFDEVAA